MSGIMTSMSWVAVERAAMAAATAIVATNVAVDTTLPRMHEGWCCNA